MFVLALECSTAHGSIALTGGWRTEFTTGRGEGGRLFTALAAAMDVVRAAGEPLSQIVVGLGPGSYSGVRQAIAAATGLAAATGAPVVGVPSSAALAVDAERYQAVGDARRGTFYYTVRWTDGRCVAGPELLEDQAASASEAGRAGGLAGVRGGKCLPEGVPAECAGGVAIGGVVAENANGRTRPSALRTYLPATGRLYPCRSAEKR